MKKTVLSIILILQILILSCLMVSVLAQTEGVRYGHYSWGGTYDPNTPHSAWIKIDVDGDGVSDYVFWFPNEYPFAYQNPAWLTVIALYHSYGYHIEIEFTVQIYMGVTRYTITDIDPA